MRGCDWVDAGAILHQRFRRATFQVRLLVGSQRLCECSFLRGTVGFSLTSLGDWADCERFRHSIYPLGIG